MIVDARGNEKVIRMATTLILAALTAWSVTPLRAQTFTDLVVFGDSLTDTGNVFDLSGGVAGGPPNFQGRFSNGPVWVEHVATAFDLPAPVASRQGGKNYAYGGAQTGDGNSTIVPEAPIPNVGPQIADFLATGEMLDEGDLVVLWAGHNDLTGGIAPSVVAENTSNHITTLQANGGKNFLVGTIFGSDELNSLNAQNFESLSDTLGVSIATFDFAGLVIEISTNPADFGFTNVNDPAWNEATGEVVPNPDEYSRWDSVPHPTAAFHRIIGDRAIEAAETIPEPSSMSLVALAFIGVVSSWRRAKRRS